jgi:hypothetical protein
MRLSRVVAILFVTAALCDSAAQAAETGSISGIVKDAQGGVLPGVVVRVTGDLLPGGREATTTAIGGYQFPRLLPGQYKVEATMGGMGASSRQARVYVDVDTQVELTLSPTKTESVEVVGDVAAVDLKSTEVNFNYTAEQYKELPLARSYNGLFQLIPGVADNRTAGGISAGGSRDDNTYLLDGVNVSNPGYGYLSTEVNELDISEFNVKRAAISAEFDRSAGAVTNAVSKSGTNTFAGSARLEYMPKQFVAGFRDKAFSDPVPSVINPAIGLGGPLVKDKLFFYASGRYFENVTSGLENKYGTPLPESKSKGHELYGKVTATPTPKHLLYASYRDRPVDVSNASLDDSSLPSVATSDSAGSRIGTAGWSFFPTDKTFLDVKYLYLFERNESEPITKLASRPAFDVNNLAAMGYYFDNVLGLAAGGYPYNNRDNYTRHELKATVSQFFDIGRTNHQLKAGVGYDFMEEDLLRTANGWGSIVSTTFSGKRAYRGRYYSSQPAQLGQATTWSIFLQDTMTVGQRFSLNAGVLLNRDDYGQDIAGSGGCPTTYVGSGSTTIYQSNGDKCTFMRFNFGDQVQPRLGFNYNVRQGKGDKVYVNWGRYDNLDQKSSTFSLAPRRIYLNQAFFDATTGALLSDAPRASTTGKKIDPAIKPTYHDEWVGGYATPLSSKWALDLYYQYRKTHNFIEDVPASLPDNGPYEAANMPCDSLDACRGAVAVRKYQAFTVELNRKMADRWSLLASYTWSKFEGNIDYDYSFALFNTSSGIQDGPGTFVQDPNRYGVLRQDRPSVFKAFLTWEPVDRFTLGGYLRVQSGTPWNARGLDYENYGLDNLEAPGSHRNPTWTNFDLLASYRIPVAGKRNLIVEGRFLNLFNNQTQLSTESLKYQDVNYFDDTVCAPGVTTPSCWYNYDGIPVNTFYGKPNGYAPPFRFLLSVRFDF